MQIPLLIVFIIYSFFLFGCLSKSITTSIVNVPIEEIGWHTISTSPLRDSLDVDVDVDVGVSEEERRDRIYSISQVPLKGWNSYDGWDWIINETDFRSSVDAVVENLLPYGYNIVTVDFYWYLSLNTSITYIDSCSRVQPDPDRFPSSAGGKGFASIAAYVHSKGLLFGIHTMRGISGAAVAAKSPICGTSYTAADVYDRTAVCPWGVASSTFYSVNMSHPAGQTFYDTLYAQYASWGVDFIKHDCVYSNYVLDQIIGAATGMHNSGRMMMYSLSPGMADVKSATVISPYVNMYRITGDTWDSWNRIQNHFDSAKTMVDFIAYPNGRDGAMASPDLDMLPLGYLGTEGNAIPPHRQCGLSKDEQYSLMTLWTIFRSPLVFGGDPRQLKNDQFTLSLLTNKEALHITDYSVNNTYIYSNSTGALWRADSANFTTDSGTSYVALLNPSDSNQRVSFLTANVRRRDQGTLCCFRNVWTGSQIGTSCDFAGGTYFFLPHQSVLIAIYNCTLNVDNKQGKIMKSEFINLNEEVIYKKDEENLSLMD